MNEHFYLAFFMGKNTIFEKKKIFIDGFCRRMCVVSFNF